MINPKTPDFKSSPVSAERPCYGYQPSAQKPDAVVSIVTPFYNTGDIFFETAQSIFNQSFQEWEWLIVDDGSTDQAALERLKSIQQRDGRVVVIRQANAGPSAARNTAFKNSKGGYICLLDSDDLINPTYIEKCVWFLESQPEFAFCNSWSVTFGDKEYLWTRGFERGMDHIDANSGPPISVIRRNAFEAAGGFDETIRDGHEDWDFWLRLAKAGFWGHTLPEYLEWYRWSFTGRFARIMSDPSANKKFEKYIRDKYGDVRGHFPQPRLRNPMPYEDVEVRRPFTNLLHKPADTKRILFLLPWMVTGGADKVNLDWIRGLIDNNYQATVCTTLRSQNDWLPEFSKLTPDIFDVTKFLHPSDYPRFFIYLITSRRIDTVLISASTLGYHLLPYLRANCPGVTFVDLCHVEEPHWLNGGHPRFGVGYQDLLDLNIVTTSHLRDWMMQRGGDGTKIKLCYSGIDSHRINAVSRERDGLRRQLEVPGDLPVIAFAGRICKQKRPQLLAEILRELAAQRTFKCFIIGDGELKPQLSKLIKEYALEPYVQLLGNVEHWKWLEVLAAADIFLMPSEYEGISVALYEAMAMDHVVPVMSDVGGQSEIVDKDCGFLVPLGDGEVQRYVEVIQHLIDHPLERHKIAQQGAAKVRTHYTSGKTISRLLEILDAAAAKSRQGSRLVLQKGFAKELATMAIEYNRMNTIADALWTQSITNKTNIQLPPSLIGVFNIITLIDQTRIGHAILHNRVLIKIGEWVLRKLASRKEQ